MAGNIRFKICGLNESRHVEAAVSAGAGYVGFVFFEKSPRFVSIKRARELAGHVPAGVAKVALSVDASDAALDAIVDGVGIDMLQLHGQESPARVAEIRHRYGLPVMKVVGVADESDLVPLAQYCKVSDQIMVDAKPPKGAILPGGNGLAFDWRLIAGRRWPVPWMLAGGLTSENVSQAIALTGAKQVDVSSGVEKSPGAKSTSKIDAFAQAVLLN